LGTQQDGNFQDTCRADEQLRVTHELLFLKDRRQHLLLNVDDDQRTLFGFERAAREFGVVGSCWGNLGSDDHRNLSERLESSRILTPK
jgi:hypothetical protein